jgi:phosphoglycerol transferase MdoB-like AlkP superfamily enzyme
VDDAREMQPPQYVSVITNTTFTFLQSLFLPQVSEKKYFDEATCKQLFTNQIFISKNDTLQNLLHRKPNVMIIIWESLAKEYVGYFNPNQKSFTPFLDSVCRNSLVCTNGFANAKHSHEGMCAVMAGIPNLMENCFYYSAYQNNRIKGVAQYLKEMGYNTAFFHGGNNGSMHFNSFSKTCGFENYFGRNEYPNPEKDFDGTWGIWDEPFFQFAAKKINEMPEPFCAGLFTVSSHHPYIVPNPYKNKFPKGEIEILQTMAYTDFALQQFFKTASKMKWFDNTLFVIVGDHTSQNANPQYNNLIGAFKLPIIFYMPGKLKGQINFPTQQVDILPTVLRVCGYEGNAATFGRSILQADSNSFTINWANDIYQINNRHLTVQFDGKKVINAFEYTSDTLCKNNVAQKFSVETDQLSTQLKAVIQTYNDALLHNKLYPNSK